MTPNPNPPQKKRRNWLTTIFGIILGVTQGIATGAIPIPLPPAAKPIIDIINAGAAVGLGAAAADARNKQDKEN